MREIIKVKNVSKVYKINKRKSGLFGAVLNLFAPRYEKKIAVSDMNFSIEEGEAVAFIGSNGAGKSTTIKMLSGILYPSEGEITVIIIDKGKKIYDGAVKNVKELCDDVKILRVEMAQGEKVSNDGLLNIKECDENIVGDDEMKAIHDTKNKTTIYRDETFFEKTFARG